LNFASFADGFASACPPAARVMATRESWRRVAGQARTEGSDERCIERTMPWGIGMIQYNYSAFHCQ
jgi:hypothetical protein